MLDAVSMKARLSRQKIIQGCTKLERVWEKKSAIELSLKLCLSMKDAALWKLGRDIKKLRREPFGEELQEQLNARKG